MRCRISETASISSILCQSFGLHLPAYGPSAQPAEHWSRNLELAVSLSSS